MHIDGDWRDHRVFSLLSEDVPFGLMHWYAREQGLTGGLRAGESGPIVQEETGDDIVPDAGPLSPLDDD